MTDDASDKEKRTHGATAWAVGLLLFAVTAYGAGYVCGAEWDRSASDIEVRKFKFGIVARLYVPVAWIEAKLGGNHVYLYATEPDSDAPGADAFSYLASGGRL